MAGPLLKTAVNSFDATVETIEEIIREIQVTMFATGTARLPDLADKIVTRKLHES